MEKPTEVDIENLPDAQREQVKLLLATGYTIQRQWPDGTIQMNGPKRLFVKSSGMVGEY